MIILNDNLIKAILDKGCENGKLPIPDGIINPTFYNEAPIKILLILKEPYDICGNKTSHIDDINELTFEEIHVWKGRNTEKRISTIISNVFHNLSYDEFHNLIKDKDKTNAEVKKRIEKDLKSIAWINVGKYPGGTSSPNSRVRKQYQIWREILFKQIETYSPDVIIFGRTFAFFEKDLKVLLGKSLTGPHGSLPSYYKDIKNNRLLIDSYHPSFRFNVDFVRKYIDNLVGIIKKKDDTD